MENQKLVVVRERYFRLKEEKRFREEDIQRAQKRVDEIKNYLSELKWLVDPHVSISKISSNIQKDRYIGKFMVYLDNGKSKQVSVSLGSTNLYNGAEDPELIRYSKEKAVNYLIDKFPEKYK